LTGVSYPIKIKNIYFTFALCVNANIPDYSGHLAVFAEWYGKIVI